MDTVTSVAAWLAVVAGGLTALGLIGRKAVQAVRAIVVLGRKLDVLADIASYELQHNSGHSIKDAVTKIPGIEKALTDHLKDATEERAAIDARFVALETRRAKTIADLAEALPVVARSTPAEEDRDGG